MKRICYVMFLVMGLMAMSTANAFAYLDPGTTTYLIQIIAGGVIAAGAAVGIYWYKFKTKIKKTVQGANKANADAAAPETSPSPTPLDAEATQTLTAADILGEEDEKE